MSVLRYYLFFLTTLLYLAPLCAKKQRRMSKKDVIAFNKEPANFTRPKFEQPSTNHVTQIAEPAPVSTETLVQKESAPIIEQSTVSESEQHIPLNDLHSIEKGDEVTDLVEESVTPEEEYIEFNFENADLQNFIKQVQEIFDITFLPDDAIEPLIKGAKAIKGNKITFRTQKPLTRDQAWELFITFMQISGFAIVKHSLPRTYRITTMETARKMPVPTFIGIHYEGLPNTDEIIRYVYFVENSSLDSIKTIVETMKSSAAPLITLQEQRAFILTDRAYNIKKLMEIVKELDKTAVPQAMSLLQLKQADAKKVKELYDSIIQPEEKGPVPGRFTSRKQPSSQYFPENLRLIVEPRRNALISIGPKDAIKKVEDFITKYIDVELSQPYSSFFVYQLKYADAITMADIMNNMTQFGKDTEAGRYGSVRGPDKYLKPMMFVAEKETNRLIVKSNFEDYMRAVEVLEKLDAPPTQVAIEILILNVSVNETKQLGVQMRSKESRIPAGTGNPGTPDSTGILGDNVKFQTSGLFGTSKIAERDTEDAPLGVQRLLGNILQVVTSAAPGNTILSLGSDLFGVWGVLQALQTVANTSTIANPFLMATNKTPAVVALGEERRVITAEVVGSAGTTDSFSTQKAELRVEITPQINSDGMIVLDITIKFDDFTQAANFTDATKNTREIKTWTVVADKEVLALGGLIKSNVVANMSKVPALGDIPILGWLFKNKQKADAKSNILILISTRIVNPHESKEVEQIVKERVDEYYGTLGQMQLAVEQKDPIHKLFFEERKNSLTNNVEDLLFARKNSDVVNKRRRVSYRRRRKQKQLEVLDREQAAQETINPQPLDSTPPKETTRNTQIIADNNNQGQLDKLLEKRRSSARPLASMLEANKRGA